MLTLGAAPSGRLRGIFVSGLTRVRRRRIVPGAGAGPRPIRLQLRGLPRRRRRRAAGHGTSASPTAPCQHRRSTATGTPGTMPTDSCTWSSTKAASARKTPASRLQVRHARLWRPPEPPGHRRGPFLRQDPLGRQDPWPASPSSNHRPSSAGTSPSPLADRGRPLAWPGGASVTVVTYPSGESTQPVYVRHSPDVWNASSVAASDQPPGSPVRRRPISPGLAELLGSLCGLKSVSVT